MVLHAEEDEIDSKSAEDKVLSLLKAALEEEDNKGQEPKSAEVRRRDIYILGLVCYSRFRSGRLWKELLSALLYLSSLLIPSTQKHKISFVFFNRMMQ